MLRIIVVFFCVFPTYLQTDWSSTDLMRHVITKMLLESDQLMISLLNSWKNSDFNRVNYTFLDQYSFVEMNKIILNIDRSRTKTNEALVNYLIDFLLNRAEMWQMGMDMSCEWCMSSLKLNQIKDENFIHGSNATLQQNLVHVQKLFSDIGLPKMAFFKFESAHELKIFLTKSIKVARRKLFLLQQSKFYAFKVWKTSNAKLHTNLVDINCSAVPDLFPTPSVLYYPLVLSDSRWIDLNEKIIALEMEQSHGNVFYKGLRLVNHFKYVRVKSVKECFAKCQENEDCAAITYRPINKDGCHFYRKNEFMVVKDPEWISASYINLPSLFL